ncbi:sugar isomerase domain-containing protein [Lysinibacillus sp. NPDC096418]|uniref:sugar isomerase domain-containing protein n=1 Tax=Lysinibacillus sp. NPDC096418 TaxID=3364138 RepID=UPI0038110211
MHTYFQEVQKLLSHVLEKEHVSIERASQVIVERLQKGGVLQLFGCGHSHLLAQEGYYRAGGLVPVRPIIIEPLTLHVGALTSSVNEKDPDIIQSYADQFNFHEQDILMVISTSGRNNAPIEAALLAKEQGIPVMSLQSLAYKEHPTRHKSEKRLEEIVDVVLDTHVPVGDGLLSRAGMQYGPASTVIGSTILNTLLSQVIEKMADQMDVLPVFESTNVTTNQNHNNLMIAKYEGRINFK